MLEEGKRGLPETRGANQDSPVVGLRDRRRIRLVQDIGSAQNQEQKRGFTQSWEIGFRDPASHLHLSLSLSNHDRIRIPIRS